MSPLRGPQRGPKTTKRSTNEETTSRTRADLDRSEVVSGAWASEIETQFEPETANGQSGRPALSPGEQLGDYRIVYPLGAGGMGQVYAVRDLRGGTDTDAGSGGLIALKYLERTSAAMLYRFKQEFRALADVTHENLISLGELVVLPESLTFFTMEMIDGVCFDEYVRGRTPAGELPNLARLRRALRQLAAGVHHLHEHGCIHRDLKPSNVMVTSEGRVVVLDFGLIQDHTGEADEHQDQIMGTPAYMSPEQAGLERAGPPADWYAVGVMLFECLSGARPFVGNIASLLLSKRECDAPDIADLVDEVPAELAELCRRMLARDPAARPSAREILALLDGRADELDHAETQDDSVTRARRVPFVGRVRELARLDAAQTRIYAEGGGQVTVHLRGPSGYGKSALVREFLSQIRDRGQTVVLQGRCLERESVPYKGLDPVIDALSVYLRRIPAEALAALEPAHPEALARLFPVLDGLWPSDRIRVGGLEVHELRQRAFASLRELLDGVARRRPLVLFIDDFHWANVDSAGLLNSLLRPADAPAMLVLVSYRDEVEQNETLQALVAESALARRDVEELFVGPLDEGDSRALARALLDEEVDDATAAGYAAGAEGSPFYLTQLAHGAPADDLSPGQLDQLVVRRLLTFDGPSRRLLAVVAVAGGPVARQVALAASGLERLDELIGPLRDAELLVVRGPILETAHARIGEVTVGELERDELRELHLSLALALEQHGSDPEALAEHFERGGERARAADHYERAARQAASSLAFLRAVALFRRTLELLPDDASPGRLAELRADLAEQLINVGRGHEAAKLLLRLAQDAERSNPARAREHRRRAADQLIKTGRVDAGLAELDKLLRSVGLSLPAGKAASLSALVWEQARAKLRAKIQGSSFERREAAAVAPKLLDQIDTCFAVVNGLSTQEILLSAVFHFRNLRLSLEAGEPYRVARALAYQCVVDTAGRDWRHVEAHMAVARGLAAELDDPQLSGFIDLCEASCHWFERRYPKSGELHERIIVGLEGVAGASWDRRTAQIHHMWTLVCQGRLREFWARAEGTTARARERGDLQELVEVSSFMAVALVLAGEVERAQEVLAGALAEWRPGRYLFGDVWAFYPRIQLSLHAREPEQAVALARETRIQMKRTFLSEHALARYNVEELLCRSYLCVAIERDDPRSARLARRLATRLRAVHNPTLTGLVAVIEAGLASREGQLEAAVARWQEAAELFEALGMLGQLAAVRVRLAAVLVDDARASSWAGEASAYFAREGIEDREGFMRVVAPVDRRSFGPR